MSGRAVWGLLVRGSRPEWHTALVALKGQQDPQRDLVKVRVRIKVRVRFRLSLTSKTRSMTSARAPKRPRRKVTLVPIQARVYSCLISSMALPDGWSGSGSG